MSRVVEHLAELTGFRDRDVLDATLVGALKDLLQPLSVAIYRRIGDPGDERWLTRARLQTGDTAATADPLWVDLETLPTLAEDPERQACLIGEQFRSVPGSPARACFPLVAETQAVGVLEMTTDAALSADDVRLVASILRIYRNMQQLLDYSERDTLTGLLNRKTFDESFLRIAAHDQHAAATAAASTAGDGQRRAALASTWLAVIDIDHFKLVNDNYGHLIGDEVLLLMSRLMRSTFRYSDHLYRFGGEEFVVLMRCGTAANAAAAIERLRANIEKYVFPQVGRITVSVGYTELRRGDSPAAAFERADKAVYHVKQNGRNAVANHADLVAAGVMADTARDSDVELF